MAVPFRRTSKRRKRLRRTHYKLELPNMVRCEQCGEWKLSHRVCPHCGYYKGRQVLDK
ncbi:50S ribosomal protein L32 [Hydrogenibacillus schlegelii]|uniref:Large ribosomal subunit protein bL32 n=1 Tax=Hydrogenibacillus schlegelii TaxID=1484 RepID=A0A132NBT1_HYDSH|nr:MULTISPECIES: 50S ribosomal protein L32 [Hydrogenibacillus]KWX07490.1 50S ribosomal protein L32 [Hydrogenibacillus schlegelii]MBE3562122.1 50S ribosomal protein L32 [Hydrogenibacillus schlegelii]MBT9281504.1 50S ribosomal protein L32 [Hydrogenibacillus schlegelii]OAR04662.1 50S ribosomal protein L32 [Hydrogenibacillus schlegelii]QZA33451.1 50S ribosomal protein L32 [Hydrogenibacillus sp. N12]